MSTALQQHRSAGRSATKPWRGPLPAKRVSPRLTLGDVLATTSKAKEGRRTLERQEPNQNLGPASPSAAAGSNFENRQNPRDSGGGPGGVSVNGPRRTGPGRSIELSNAGKTAWFTGFAGLEHLFARTSKLRTRVPGVQAKATTDAPSDHRKRTGDEMQGSGAGVGGRGSSRWEADHARCGRSHGLEHGGFGGGHGRDHGYGGVEGEGDSFVGQGAFGDAPYGYNPGQRGYGFQGCGAQVRHSNRPRGSRGIGARRGGFAGRVGRPSTPRGGFSSAHYTGWKGAQHNLYPGSVPTVEAVPKAVDGSQLMPGRRE